MVLRENKLKAETEAVTSSTYSVTVHYEKTTMSYNSESIEWV